MELDIKFEEKDMRIVQGAFSKLVQLGKSDGITRKMANVLREDAEDAFEGERSPKGEAWQDLDPAYKKSRHAQGYDGKILHRTGILIDSLNIDYGDDFAAVGISEHYGVYHQLGTKNMKARPFLGISEDGVEEIKDILKNAIRSAWRD
ncbi:phage virion morphogenesis protein [Aggregatibacter actinomycetemcomitans]|uniref:phage virion morphogenesis protein n=1 Tax=Aggregatibacter actinomycetemcomitans TaxID=714 RepID=UPI00023FEC00|nr:phage virion morphogenesis protein [Aggregatibacter actinomycetemcomitans]EHK89824.1 Mu-like phage G protein 1 [Aggregatibacter actinomycetemcomitans RhAA1]KNE76919.1 Mu-like prophage FluMu G protein 1 [Aggregatibacter actinomycetemcomitans RhAA1]